MRTLKLEDNLFKIYLLKFFTMFLVLMPVIVPYFQSVGIGMKGVYLIQSVFAVTMFICEIPSGYISDLLGRKKTLVISAILKGIGFSLFPFANDLNTFIIAEIILGIAVSLNSGTDTALIYDTLEATRNKKAQIKILGKSLSYLTLGEGLASLIGSILLLLTFTVRDLAVVSAIVSWIPLFITLTLVEPSRKKMVDTHRENIRHIYKGLFKQSRLLSFIILNSIFSFSGTLFAVWLFQKYWEDLGIALVYFGFLWAMTNFTASFFSRYAHKIEKKWGSAKIIILLGLLPIVGYLGISYLDHVVLGFLVCLLFQVVRGIGQVVFKDALNKRVTGDFRATANSVTQMGVKIFFTVGGPVFGYFIDLNGLAQASFYMGMFYVAIFIFCILPLINERKNYMSI
jgi:MFS family permease